ncbi:MAG: bacteriohemerythrin [Sideroxyarcus sp.]
MAFLEWTRELEFDIPVIDDQHKRIVAFINELHDALATGNAEETGHVMEGLLNYTVTHFEFEEDLQEKAGYPFLKAHRRIHEIFMKKVASIRERGVLGEDIAPELLKLLKAWLASHIKGEDRDYVESVRKITESRNQEIAGWLNSALKRFFAY